MQTIFSTLLLLSASVCRALFVPMYSVVDFYAVGYQGVDQIPPPMRLYNWSVGFGLHIYKSEQKRWRLRDANKWCIGML